MVLLLRQAQFGTLRPTTAYGRYHHLRDVAGQPVNAPGPLDSCIVMWRGGETIGTSRCTDLLRIRPSSPFGISIPTIQSTPRTQVLVGSIIGGSERSWSNPPNCCTAPDQPASLVYTSRLVRVFSSGSDSTLGLAPLPPSVCCNGGRACYRVH